MEHRTTCLGCMNVTNGKTPFDKKGKCDRFTTSLSTHTCTIDDDYLTILWEIVRRKDNAYVAHSIVKATCNNIPMRCMERFMEEVAKVGRRENAEHAMGQTGPAGYVQGIQRQQNLVFHNLGSNCAPLQLRGTGCTHQRGGGCVWTAPAI